MERQVIRVTREILAQEEGMESLAPQGTLDPPAPQDPTAPQDLAGTLLLRWQVDLMRKLEELRWE